MIQAVNHQYRQEATQALLCERKLSNFIKSAWKIVEPSTPFISNWHIDCISDYLEAVTKRQIKDLLITIPPRHMKSLSVSVFWPTWVWINNPETRWIFSSYNQDFSTRDSLKCRRIIESDWYEKYWGDRFHMTSDQNVKQKFENNKTGFRLSSSIGGGITGEGGDFIVVDDPHNLKEIHSKVKRDSIIQWWDEVMSTRKNDPMNSCRVVIMQRGHQNDLVGHCLKKGGYTHLKIPGIATKKTVVQIPKKSPHIRKEGDLLWPKRFPKQAMDVLERDLGRFGFAGQVQQEPSPEGGAIWEIDWFKQSKKPANVDDIIQSWDTAFKEKEENDYSVCSTWLKHVGGYHLKHIWRGRANFPQLQKKAIQLYNLHKPSRVLIEDKASGQSLIQVLGRLFPVFAIGVDRDKVSRAYAVSACIESGMVTIEEGAEWISTFFDEVEMFPNGDHDDQVDSVTQALMDFLGLGKQDPQIMI